MARKRQRKTRKAALVILTDARGTPIEKPRRADFSSDVDYIRAFHAYKDKITNIANGAFDAALRKYR